MLAAEFQDVGQLAGYAASADCEAGHVSVSAEAPLASLGAPEAASHAGVAVMCPDRRRVSAEASKCLRASTSSTDEGVAPSPLRTPGTVKGFTSAFPRKRRVASWPYGRKPALPNPPLQRTGASVAALPLAPAAERPYRWADGNDDGIS